MLTGERYVVPDNLVVAECTWYTQLGGSLRSVQVCSEGTVRVCVKGLEWYFRKMFHFFSLCQRVLALLQTRLVQKRVRGLGHTGVFNRHLRRMWMFNVVDEKCFRNLNRCVHALLWSLRSLQAVWRGCASVIQFRLVKRAVRGANKNDESNHTVKLTQTRCPKGKGKD